MLHISMRIVDASPSHPPLLGEFGGSGLFWGILTSSFTFATVFASIQALCSCVRLPDASVLFLGLCGSSGHGTTLVPGEYGLPSRFWLF